MQAKAGEAEIDRQRPLDLVAAVVEQLALVGNRRRHAVADRRSRSRGADRGSPDGTAASGTDRRRWPAAPVGPEADVAVGVEIEPVERLRQLDGAAALEGHGQRVRGPAGRRPRSGTGCGRRRGRPLARSAGAGRPRTGARLRGAGCGGGTGSSAAAGLGSLGPRGTAGTNGAVGDIGRIGRIMARPVRLPRATIAAPRNADSSTSVRYTAERFEPDACKIRVNNDGKNACDAGALRLSHALPNFARACGRVSVGGHPDKRPDSRPRTMTYASVDTPNRQPEAKPAHPVLNGGRGLKQRRTGFFGLVGPPKVGTEEACFIIAGRADGVSPSNPRQHRRVKNPRVAPCLHRTADATTSLPADAGRPVFGRPSDLQSGARKRLR